jgi:hypothetical protein
LAKAIHLTDRANQLLMAVDATDNVAFVSLVIGYSQDIENYHERICQSLGLKTIHMRRLARKMKMRVLRQLDGMAPSSVAVSLHCLRIYFEAQKDAAERERPDPYYPRRRIYETVNRSTIEEVRRAIDPWLANFNAGRSWSMFSIEADSDTKRLVKTIGATVNVPGAAHELADAVAWSNHAAVHLKCVRRHNLVSDITVRVRKRLRR